MVAHKVHALIVISSILISSLSMEYMSLAAPCVDDVFVGAIIILEGINHCDWRMPVKSFDAWYFCGTNHWLFICETDLGSWYEMITNLLEPKGH